jgi:hypothetical protein
MGRSRRGVVRQIVGETDNALAEALADLNEMPTCINAIQSRTNKFKGLQRGQCELNSAAQRLPSP